ncbi:MAG: hypothetical protein CVV24_14205 [Ignavibacteriae bacterium HGW-Ignavibacteriae-3]|nr:MAG: hypothetical protein CVV24_14205 [Ignavibacteriae bacterium HGW-Ignavibacteriae-3]
MKIIHTIVLLALISSLDKAQFKPIVDAEISTLQDASQHMPSGLADRIVSMGEINRYSDLLPNPKRTAFPENINTSLTDTMKYNMYGDLRDDDPLYNPKSTLGMVVLEVTIPNLSTFLIDRYIFNYEFSRVGFNSWKHSLQKGWEWDIDRFGMNYFFHPFSGSMYYNAARANGYSFYESIPFAFLGSLQWEYLGENTLPSYNDFINTPVHGILLGEIFYRLGSNILDDRTTGTDRFFREMAVAILTPTRFLSRLFKGNLTRITPSDVYQKEPLNITLAGGYHRVNDGIKIEKGSNSINFSTTLDYGNPFEKRSRKPFDYFRLKTDLDFGVGRKIISLITGYGLLTGKNIQAGDLEMLAGLFQHMNFFDNKTFELGTIGFGPGMVSKMLVGRNSSLYTNLHLNLVPFGALSNRFGPDTTQVKDYDYGFGAQAKLECNYNISGWMGISFIGYYWWLHAFGEIPGNIAGESYIALIKPSISFKIFPNIDIGFEHLVYYSDRYPSDFASVHSVRTEQKIFIQIFIEQFKFKK